MSNHQIIATADGSHSLYLADLDETYHSRNGAIQEALHVFVQHGLRPLLQVKSEINVLEVGFGTGLNTVLSLLDVQDSDARINYHSIEKYPLAINLAMQLNYTECIGSAASGVYSKIHLAEWQKQHQISPNFSLFKDACDLDNLQMNEWADLVFYDAFGPRVQPNMWNHQKLGIVHRAMRTGGILVTYCAQGQFKRVLKDLNFKTESLPGPPGKREMTRAIKL
jgi:tRNA U34 5-methylaminomethyl-2-thiouridine-forming methyltransferase MnmC